MIISNYSVIAIWMSMYTYVHIHLVVEIEKKTKRACAARRKALSMNIKHRHIHTHKYIIQWLWIKSSKAQFGMTAFSKHTHNSYWLAYVTPTILRFIFNIFIICSAKTINARRAWTCYFPAFLGYHDKPTDRQTIQTINQLTDIRRTPVFPSAPSFFPFPPPPLFVLLSLTLAAWSP